MKKEKLQKGIKKLLVLIAVLIVTLTCLVAFVVWEGLLIIGEPINNQYSVYGIDVSHYQGEIKWNQIKEDMGITFAFIKATEGSKHVDEKFHKNWDKAKQSGVYVGAYHFFSFESDGKKQAENFIEHVSATPNTLPPVVDVEYYGKYAKKPLDKKKVQKQLDDFLYTIEEYYDKKPIIYTTMSCYEDYIAEYYNDYTLWIRNTYYRPYLNTNRQWVFWQYSEEGKWPYSDGANEENVDMNVFYGDFDCFLRYFDLEAAK